MRGGKREGAGRKPALDFLQRVRIGAECDRRANMLAKDAQKKKFALRYEETDSEESLAIINKVPLSQTRKSDGKSARQIVLELSLLEVIPDAGYPKGVLAAAEHLKARHEILEDVGRFSPGKRPYRHRQQVISNVAAWASDRFKCRVNARYVETCWKEYRRQFPPAV